MKNFFESFLTSVFLTVIVLLTVVSMSLIINITSTYSTYSACWHAVESSEIRNEEDVILLENQLNQSVKQGHSSWNVTIETLTNNETRPYYLVTLNYKINVPILDLSFSGKRFGYSH